MFLYVDSKLLKTEAQRQSSGDPRPSVEERYHSIDQYFRKVTDAIDDLIEHRLMLCEDAANEQARLLQAGLDAGISVPDGKVPAPTTPRHCRTRSGSDNHHDHKDDKDKDKDEDDN